MFTDYRRRDIVGSDISMSTVVNSVLLKLCQQLIVYITDEFLVSEEVKKTYTVGTPGCKSVAT